MKKNRSFICSVSAITIASAMLLVAPSSNVVATENQQSELSALDVHIQNIIEQTASLSADELNDVVKADTAEEETASSNKDEIKSNQKTETKTISESTIENKSVKVKILPIKPNKETITEAEKNISANKAKVHVEEIWSAQQVAEKIKTVRKTHIPTPSIGEALPTSKEVTDFTAKENMSIYDDDNEDDDDNYGRYEYDDYIPETTLIHLPLNKTKIIEFDRKVRDVMVASPSIVDVKVQTPQMAYIVAKSVGDTNIIFTDKNGNIISRIELHVQLDTMAVQELLSNVLPGENIKVSAANDNLILSGSVSSNVAVANAVSVARTFVADATNIVNMLSVQGEQQVLLKVKVAEMQRSVLKELGFSTGLGSNNIGSEYFYSWTSGANTLDAGGSGATSLYTGTLENAAGTFSTTLRALETSGLLKTLAEPNMVAVSGETASLLAGGEYPIPVSDSDGQITFEFKPYGVGLSFTPVVLSSGKISLKLATEVSSLSSETVTTANTSIPAINVRRANTTVEMPSGGSLMIAGLLQNDVISNLSGVPGLKDLPILGTLFRSQQFQRNETELVISITALLVKPHDPNELSLPTDGFAPSSDLDRMLIGRLYQAHTLKSLPPSTAEIEGPVGYIMK